MIKTLVNAWKLPEVRKKIIYTLLLILIFRIGCMIPVPGVDSLQLAEYVESNSNSLVSTLNIISGGALTRLSIFTLSIGPYITASIVVQLLTLAIPALEQMKREGEEGKKKMNRIMKYLTVVLAIFEGFGVFVTYGGSQGIFLLPNYVMIPIFLLTVTAGTAFLTWLGDQITEKGIGNGISMLIFVGIVSALPAAITLLLNVAGVLAGALSVKGVLIALGITLGALLLIAAVVFVQEAERRIPVQYAKRVVGRKMYGGQSTHIPMKLVMAGVIPIILAMALMTFPALIVSFLKPELMNNIADGSGFLRGLVLISQPSLLISAQAAITLESIIYVLIHSIIYMLLIVGFTFFYTLITFNPIEVSNNLKRNGGFVPGIRPGKPTSDYLKGIANKLTWFGSVYLGIVAIIPIAFQLTGLPISFGGTAVLIIVGVALEFMKQLESQMLIRNYKGFLE